MESKNIKIVDEHGIDRVANVVCSIDVDGSDYVIYWIERDNDNDNLFVSKLIKNNDGTSNMINIEDTMEKGNLNEIVKELITHSINDDNDVLNSISVVLKNGKTIKVASVLFNKEQNINVQKTYITTVKKSVTKVSETYYHVQPILDAPVVEMPEIDATLPPAVSENPVVEPIVSSTPEVPEQVNVPVEAIPEVPVTPLPVVDTPTVEMPSVQETPVVEPTPVPTIPEVTIPLEPEVQPEPIVETPVQNVDARINIIGASSAPVDSMPPVTPDVVDKQPVINEPPVMSIPEQPVMATPEPNPASLNTTSNELFFDGSKETNLTDVFGGNTSAQSNLNVNTVEPIREFGQDEPVAPVVNDVQPVDPDVKTSGSAGFANNKFFMVIAIAFFIAACVFLGYEVFKYFQIK